MKILHPFNTQTLLRKFILVVSIFLFSFSTLAAPGSNEKEALAKAKKDLKHKIDRITTFHHAARLSMTESLQKPLFKQYFNLPESRHDHYDDLGRIQLTEKQHQIRHQMEQWILTIHSKFPIGETCLIDDNGQEHLRVVGGKLENPHMFSSEEHGSPFFTPTFKLKEGEVHISEPYMSEDTLFWATSFTSPIYLDDGSIPGFYHFEIPLAAYSDLISFKEFSFSHFQNNELDTEEEGRYFIINKDNLVIADSESKINFILPDQRNPNINLELPDYLPPESLKNYSGKLSKILPENDSVLLAKKMHQQRQGTMYMNIFGRKYLLIFEPVPDRPDWILAHLDPIGGPGYWDLKVLKKP